MRSLKAVEGTISVLTFLPFTSTVPIIASFKTPNDAKVDCDLGLLSCGIPIISATDVPSLGTNVTKSDIIYPFIVKKK